MFTDGTTTLRLASKQPVFPEVPNFGKHGTRTFSKLFAQTKLLMVTGRMATIFMETLIFTAQPWQF